jgi:hypothetical protein
MSALPPKADIKTDLHYVRRNNSGSLAVFTAIRRAGPVQNEGRRRKEDDQGSKNDKTIAKHAINLQTAPAKNKIDPRRL